MDWGPALIRCRQRLPAFTAELEAGRVPSLRAIRAWMHVGQSRAQRLRAYLAELNGAGQAGHSVEYPAATPPIPSAA